MIRMDHASRTMQTAKDTRNVATALMQLALGQWGTVLDRKALTPSTQQLMTNLQLVSVSSVVKATGI